MVNLDQVEREFDEVTFSEYAHDVWLEHGPKLLAELRAARAVVNLSRHFWAAFQQVELGEEMRRFTGLDADWTNLGNSIKAYDSAVAEDLGQDG